jgi:hypothetical protein
MAVENGMAPNGSGFLRPLAPRHEAVSFMDDLGTLTDSI